MKVYVVILPGKQGIDLVAGIYGSQVLALQEAHTLGGQVVSFPVIVETGKRKSKEVA